MIRIGLVIIFFFQFVQANAATGDKFWKDCPGPACPAKEPESEHSIKKESAEQYERIDREDLRKERKRHEREIKALEKEERRRDINH